MTTLETDILVIAGGASGLAAAVTAAERGCKVLILEKASTTGGAANMAAGVFAAESRLQRIKAVGPTRAEAFKIFMDYTHWRADARLVKAYIDKSADTIDWLEKIGVEFSEPSAMFLGSHPTWHLVKPGKASTGSYTPHAGRTMIKVLTTRAKQEGVEIILEAPVKKIIKQEGRISGVLAENKSGEKIEAHAKGVIIATGGFGNNPEMIRKYTGYEHGRDLFSVRIPGITGDGIRMAWEAGAAETEMRMELVYGMAGEVDRQVLGVFREPHLMVNVLGERFANEEVLRNPAFTGNAISRQKNRYAYVIFDENVKRSMEEKGLDSICPTFPFTKIEDLDARISKTIRQERKDIFVADSIKDLADQAGIDAKVLERTVDEYNQSCAKGWDDVFDKSHRYLRPVKEPKFYAGRLVPTGFGTLGGIKINHRTEVLNRKWDVIPGLYAVGNDACSIFGDTYVFVLPGNTLGFALNSGRIAGENASEYVRSLLK